MSQTLRAACALLVALLPSCNRSQSQSPAGGQDSSMVPSVVDEAAVRCPALLTATRRGGSDANRYVAPTDAERATLRDAVAALVKEGAAARNRVAASLGAAGFELVDVPEIPHTVLVREVDARRRGGGAYLLRFDASAPSLAVEAPHTFYDEGTLPIGCDLFQRTKAGALFINTVHRYKASLADEHNEHPSDVAHNPSSLFQAATEGLLRSIPALTVVQVHGFGSRGDGTSMILSAGEKHEDDLVTRAAAAVARVVPGVKKYPESGELGATTNVQGQIVRQAGGRFLHVEMDSLLRQNLVSDAHRRGLVLDALAAALLERPR